MKKAALFSGLAVVAAGIAVVAGFFLTSSDFTPEMGLSWNYANMEVVLNDEVHETVINLRTFRERYAMYNDMADGELIKRMHGKYFSGMPIEDFNAVFKRKSGPVPEKHVKFSPGFTDPFNIRGDFDKDVRVIDPITRSIMSQDAIDYGFTEYRRVKNSFPYRYALIAGLALIGSGGLIAGTFGYKKD